MFKIIIPILVIALAAFVGMNAKSGLIRGVADGMLVSPARPAVAVKPAADFASVDARRVDLSPSVQNSMLQATSVQAVYALYVCCTDCAHRGHLLVNFLSSSRSFPS